VDITRVY